MNIRLLIDASLASITTLLPKTFHISTYGDMHTLRTLLKESDTLLCRSTTKMDPAFFKDSTIGCIATASSGRDHIPGTLLSQNNISLLDARGANAPAVADYVLASVACLQTHHALLCSPQLHIGIIGMGYVGQRVHAQLQQPGYRLTAYDPWIPDPVPWQRAHTLNELQDCDVICVHPDLHDRAPHPSRNLLDHAFFKMLRPGTVIINAARGGVVDEAALLAYRDTLFYCTDVYHNEPHINPAIINMATLCTPHIAGHAIESKKRIITTIAQKLCDYYKLAIHIPQEPAPLLKQNNPCWQSRILSYYNPQNETNALQRAVFSDLPQGFLSLRAAHTTRHDFSAYSTLHAQSA